MNLKQKRIILTLFGVAILLILIVLIAPNSIATESLQADGQSYSQKNEFNQEEVATPQEKNQIIPQKGAFEIPKILSGEQIIYHNGYSLVYSEKHEQAKWVAYDLTALETRGGFERSDDFRVDPKISSGSADDSDYKGSGFDRGHLAPAADLGWSAGSMQASFFYSNMSPQAPSFNRGIWKKLEEQVRSWALAIGTIYIATGPLLKENLPTIGANHVSVPEYYYKVILNNSKDHPSAIGFILPNQASSLDLKYFATSIDEVEEKTGIDFFPLLPDNVEGSLEKNVCTECWDWRINRVTTNKTNTEENSAATSVQCSGITAAGARCKRMTKSASGRCYQHE